MGLAGNRRVNLFCRGLPLDLNSACKRTDKRCKTAGLAGFRNSPKKIGHPEPGVSWRLPWSVSWFICLFQESAMPASALWVALPDASGRGFQRRHWLSGERQFIRHSGKHYLLPGHGKYFWRSSTGISFPVMPFMVGPGASGVYSLLALVWS